MIKLFDTNELLTFNEFLLEINYGIAQKEKRFDALKDVIIDDITKYLTNHPRKKMSMSNIIDDIHIVINYIEYKDIQFDLKWKILWNTKDIDNYGEFIDEMSTNFSDENFVLLKFRMTPEENDPPNVVISKLKEYIKTRYFEVMLVHEIGHILDFLDELYQPPFYEYYKNSKTSTPEDYMSQDMERNVYFSTVIKDLERLKELHPKMKLSDVLEISDYYQNFITKVRPIFRKKFLSKIVYFWTSNYGTDDMTRRLPHVK
jgi:hypothetical protein